MTTRTDAGIELEAEAGIATITIARPEVRNALDLAAAHALMDAVETVEADPEIAVAIVTGVGPAFSAGADLKARERGEPRAVIEPFGFGGFVRKPRTKPFIAAVNGFAVGGGFEIAMACDLAVAAPAAHFALPEVARGLIGTGDCLPFLADRLPVALATELALTGRRLGAAEALDAGLLNAVGVSPVEIARGYAEQIAANAPLAVRATLSLLRTLRGTPPPGYHALADAHQRHLFTTADAAEGARSFLEKRSAVWTGR